MYDYDKTWRDEQHLRLENGISYPRYNLERIGYLYRFKFA